MTHERLQQITRASVVMAHRAVIGENYRATEQWHTIGSVAAALLKRAMEDKTIESALLDE